MYKIASDTVDFNIENRNDYPIQFRLFGVFSGKKITDFGPVAFANLNFETDNFIFNPNTSEYYLVHQSSRTIAAISQTGTVNFFYQLPASAINTLASATVGYDSVDNAFYLVSANGGSGFLKIERNTLIITAVGLISPVTAVLNSIATTTTINNSGYTYVRIKTPYSFTITTPDGEVLSSFPVMKEIREELGKVVALSSQNGKSTLYNFSQNTLEIDATGGLTAEGIAKSYADMPALVKSIKIVSSSQSQLLNQRMIVANLGNNNSSNQNINFGIHFRTNQFQNIVELDVSDWGLKLDGKHSYSMTIEAQTDIHIQFFSKRLTL